MRILYQTSLTSPNVIYDTDAPVRPSDPNSIGSRISRFLHPVIQVQMDDGSVLYKTGNWYKPYPVGQYVVMGLVGVGLLAGLLAYTRR